MADNTNANRENIEQSLAEKANNGIETMMLMEFLSDPKRTVEEYLAAGGPVPRNFVEMIKGFLPLAKMLGLDVAEIPEAADLIGQLTADDIGHLFFGKDGNDTFKVGDIELSKFKPGQFEKVFNSNEFFRETLANILSVEQKHSSLQDSFALGFALSPEEMGLSADDPRLQEKALSIPLQDYKSIIMGLDDDATLKVLHGLPYDQAQKVLDSLVLTDGKPIEGLYAEQLDDTMSKEEIAEAIDAAIEQRVNHGVGQHNDSIPNLKGNFIDKALGTNLGEAAEQALKTNYTAGRGIAFTLIRAELSEQFGSGFKKGLRTAIKPEDLKADRVLEILMRDEKKTRKMIKDNWTTIQVALSDPEMIGVIFDAMGLQDQLNKGLLGGIKGAFMTEPLVMAAKLLQQLFSFIKPYIQKYFPGAKLSVDYDSNPQPGSVTEAQRKAANGGSNASLPSRIPKTTAELTAYFDVLSKKAKENGDIEEDITLEKTVKWAAGNANKMVEMVQKHASFDPEQTPDELIETAKVFLKSNNIDDPSGDLAKNLSISIYAQQALNTALQQDTKPPGPKN